MASQKSSIINSAGSSLLSKMYELRMNSDSADLDLICGDKEWKVHSSILALRSPFFKAAIANNMLEKKEMRIDIRHLDPEAMLQTINFMYGLPLGEAPINFLFEAVERFQMNDMKADVARIALRIIDVENAVELGKLAELYNIPDLIKECTKFIIENDIAIKEELPSKFTMSLMSAMQKALKDGQQKSEELESNCQEKLMDKERNCQEKLRERGRLQHEMMENERKSDEKLIKVERKLIRLNMMRPYRNPATCQHLHLHSRGFIMREKFCLDCGQKRG